MFNAFFRQVICRAHLQLTNQRLVAVLLCVFLGSLAAQLALYRDVAKRDYLQSEVENKEQMSQSSNNTNKGIVNIEAADTINLDSRLHRNGLLSLFRHEVPPQDIRDDILSRITNVSIVVSHCNYPLNWIAEFASGFEPIIDSIWIFTKCDQDIVGAPNGSKIIKLPNVGGCDHTYAHVMRMFGDEPGAGLTIDSLTLDHELIVFFKDNDYSRPHWGKQNFGDLLSRAALYGYGCLKQDLIPSIVHEYNGLRAFEMLQETYDRRGGEKVTDTYVPFKNEAFATLGEWVDNLSLPLHPTQNLLIVCHGGFFATTKTQILRHPKWVWEAIERSLSRGNNIIEGHFAERTFGALLSKPFSNATAREIWEKRPEVTDVNVDWPLSGMITFRGKKKKKMKKKGKVKRKKKSNL